MAQSAMNMRDSSFQYRARLVTPSGPGSTRISRSRSSPSKWGLRFLFIPRISFLDYISYPTGSGGFYSSSRRNQGSGQDENSVFRMRKRWGSDPGHRGLAFAVIFPGIAPNFS